MKEYFKYGRRYVNINDECLFLTNSGNWSEIQSIVEKSPKLIRKNRLKTYRDNLFFLIIFFLLCYVDVLQKSFNLKASFALLILAVGVYWYLTKKTGNKYKIPLKKISAISIIKKEVKISFLNADDMEDYEIIKNVEEKGLKILSKLLPQPT